MLYTEADREFVHVNAATMTDRQLAAHLSQQHATHIPGENVRALRHRIGIFKNRVGPPSQMEFITANYRTMPDRVMAAKLGIPQAKVKYWRLKLGLVKEQSHYPSIQTNQ